MMHSSKRTVAAIVYGILVLCCQAGEAMVRKVSPPQGPITLESLLAEMTNRDRLARVPSPAYESLQFSSYNRASVAPGQPGWFTNNDGNGSIRKEEINGHTEWVLMEHSGPGCITRIWTPFFYDGLNNHGGPHLKIYLDGSTIPVIDENFIELVTRGDYPGAPPIKNSFTIPSPLAEYTARAGVLYLPIPFARSCKITTDQRNFYNIINYRAYTPDVAVKSFTMADYRAALPRMTDVGRALLSAPASSGRTQLTVNRMIDAGHEASITLPPGDAAVRHVEIQLGPSDGSAALRSTVLQMTFDGCQTVWCPVGDFFCSGNEINPFHTWSRTMTKEGVMTCRWVMPYRASGQIKLVNLGVAPVHADMTVEVGDWTWDDRSMYFHSNWHIERTPVPGDVRRDWNFIDISGQGVFIADAWTVLYPGTVWWGEGDEKIWVDHDFLEEFPSHHGTGSEDYYGWAGGEPPSGADEFSHPFLSNVRVGNRNNPRGYNINTRSRVLDAVPFHSRFKLDIETWPCGDERPWMLLHYSAVTYWYALAGAQCNRGAQADEAARPIVSLEDLQRMSDAIKQRIERERQ